VTFPEVKLSDPAFMRGRHSTLCSGRCWSLWARGGGRRTVALMRHRVREVATRAVPAVALTFAVGAAVAGCATAAATAGAPATTTGPATRTTAPVYGPPAADPACVAAGRAQQTLQSDQGRDQNNESALDQDFMNFAAALSSAAQNEKRPATAQAMTALANDYTDLVESQSGAANLPDMSQIQKDGAAFDKACSL
jgi:hypothetical protein